MAHPFAACQSGQLTAARLRRTFTVLPFRAENKLFYNIALLPIFFKKFCGVQKRFSKPDHGTDVIVTIFFMLADATVIFAVAAFAPYCDCVNP